MRTGRAAVLPSPPLGPGCDGARRALAAAGPATSAAALRRRARRLHAARPAAALHHHRHAALAAGIAALLHVHRLALLRCQHDQYDQPGRRRALQHVRARPAARERCHWVVLQQMVQQSLYHSTGPRSWRRCSGVLAAARRDVSNAPRVAAGGDGIAGCARAGGHSCWCHCWPEPDAAPRPARPRPAALPLPDPAQIAQWPVPLPAWRPRAALGRGGRAGGGRAEAGGGAADAVRGMRRGDRADAEQQAASARGRVRHAALRREGLALGARRGGRAGNERVRRAARSGGRRGLRAATRCARQGTHYVAPLARTGVLSWPGREECIPPGRSCGGARGQPGHVACGARRGGRTAAGTGEQSSGRARPSAQPER